LGSAVRDAAAGSRRAQTFLAEFDGHLSSWADQSNGSHSSQQVQKEARRLLQRLDFLDLSDEDEVVSLSEDFDTFDQGSRDAVAADAERAIESAEQALESAEEGDWESAVRHLRQSVSIENRFGDAPAWMPVLRIAQETVQSIETKLEEALTLAENYELPDLDDADATIARSEFLLGFSGIDRDEQAEALRQYTDHLALIQYMKQTSR
jgi:hypothetical protein